MVDLQRAPDVGIDNYTGLAVGSHSKTADVQRNQAVCAAATAGNLELSQGLLVLSGGGYAVSL